jgi:hypothetical protein
MIKVDDRGNALRGSNNPWQIKGASNKQSATEPADSIRMAVKKAHLEHGWSKRKIKKTVEDAFYDLEEHGDIL